MVFRTCTTCKQDKPATGEYFVRDSRCPDGIKFTCKVCRSDYLRVWNKTEAGVKNRKRSWANFYSKNKVFCVNRSRAYRAAHPEETRLYNRQYKEYNRDLVSTYNKTYAKNNKEKILAKNHNRRSRLKGAEGKITASVIKQIVSVNNYCCAYCTKEIKTGYTIDHIIPLSRGGTNKIDNLTLACRSCNSSKRTRTAEEFRSLLQCPVK